MEKLKNKGKQTNKNLANDESLANSLTWFLLSEWSIRISLQLLTASQEETKSTAH